MNRIGYYTTPEEGPLSWGAVRKGVKDVSDADFRKQFAKMAFKNNKGPGLFSRLKSAFTGPAKRSVLRAPHEGASRPGSISAAINSDRPGFIAGLGAASESVGAEILAETKDKGSKMILMVLVLGLFLFIKSRTF